jgi:hypothetical protein
MVGSGARLLAVVAVLAFGACATRPVCRNYEPVIPACSPDFEYRCETTKDGCYVCGCVPIVDDEGRSPMLPPPN